MGVTISPNPKKIKVWIDGYTGKKTNPPAKAFNQAEVGDNKVNGEGESPEEGQETKE